MQRILLALGLAVGVACAAHAQPTPDTMGVRDASGVAKTLRVERNPDGSVATHSVPEVNGAAVSAANPLPTAAAVGTYANGSATLSTTATDIFAARSRVRLKLINTDYITASGGSGIVTWCRYGTAALAPALPHGVGSFPLFPGGGIDDESAGVSQLAVNCVAESGAPVLYAEQY